MNASNHLANGRVNVSQIRESSRKELCDILDKLGGTKCIVWGEDLIGPIYTIADYPMLKAHGATQMIKGCVPGLHISTQAQNVVFIIKADYKCMDIVAQCVKANESSQSRHDFHIIFVPRQSFLCVQRLEQLGVSVQKHDFLLEIYPLDYDLMSLQLDNVFRECHVEDNTSQLLSIARAVMVIQSLYGIIPNIKGKGPLASKLWQLMLRLRRELSGKESPQMAQIDSLILIDRTVDTLTPLATQLTYEGLLDEVFGIENNSINLPGAKFADEKDDRRGSTANETVSFLLNSAEDLYSSLRDQNFSSVGPTLSKMTKNLQKQYNERHEATTIPAMRDFVKKLAKMAESKKSLAKHTAMAELINEHTLDHQFIEDLFCEQELLQGEFNSDNPHPHIEDCIVQNQPLEKVFRLMCIHSFVANGLKPKVLEHYKREVVHQYGYDTVVTLKNLEKCGLLKPYQGYQKGYAMIRKTLKLNIESVNDAEPNDIAYVYSGYAPLSVRLVQFQASPGWRAISDVLDALPGETVGEFQSASKTKILQQRRNSGASLQSAMGFEDKKVALVVFIGGCTFAEVSALRFLSQQEDSPMEYLVLTTGIINGNSFIRTLMQ